MDGLKPAWTVPVTQAEPDLESLSWRVRHGDKRALAVLGQQFESLFLTQIIKEMRQTLEPDGLFGKDGGDVMGGLFDLHLGKHLAQAGGLGIGAMLQRQLEQQWKDKSAPPAKAPCEAITRKYRPSA